MPEQLQLMLPDAPKLHAVDVGVERVKKCTGTSRQQQVITHTTQRR